MAELGITHPFDQRLIDMHRLTVKSKQAQGMPVSRVQKLAAATSSTRAKLKYRRRTVDEELREELYDYYTISPTITTPDLHNQLKSLWAAEFRDSQYQSWYTSTAIEWSGDALPPAYNHHYLWTDARRLAIIRLHIRFNRYKYLAHDNHRIYNTGDGWCQHLPCNSKHIKGDRTHMLLHCPAHDEAREKCYQQISSISNAMQRYAAQGMSVQFVLGTYVNMDDYTRQKCRTITGEYLIKVDNVMEKMCVPVGLIEGRNSAKNNI